MTKFRSLLFREMRLSRKNYLIQGGMLLLFAAMMWGMLFTVQSEKMAAQIGSESFSAAVEIAILTFTLMGAAVGFAEDELFRSDLNTGWMTYSYALAVTPTDRALVKVVRQGIESAAAMLFSLLNIWGICLYGELPFRAEYIVGQLLAADAMLLPQILSDHISLGARTAEDLRKRKERGGMVCLVLMLVYIALFFKVSDLSLKELFAQNVGEDMIPTSNLFDHLSAGMLWWLIPLTLALNALRFWVLRDRLSHAYDTAAISRKKPSAVLSPAAGLTRSHSEPVGFLYKEIRQNRDQILLAAALPLIVMLFIALVIGGGLWFSPENFEGTYAEVITGELVSYLAPVLGYFFISGILTSVFSGDDKKLWAYFAAATPAGVKGFLYYKYVLCFAMNGLYMVSWIFTNSVMDTLQYALLGTEAQSTNNLMPAFFFMLLVNCAVDIPLIVRFGAKKGNTVKLWIMTTAVSVATVVFAKLIADSSPIIDVLVGLLHGEGGKNLVLILSFGPLLALAAYVFSYQLSCKWFMKGVENYDK